MVRHPQLKLYNLKHQTLKHVENIRISEKPTFDTSLERSRPGKQILIITVIRHNQVKLYYPKPQHLNM